MAIIQRPSLVYPGTPPGIDWSHPLLANRMPGSIVSAVAVPGNTRIKNITAGGVLNTYNNNSFGSNTIDPIIGPSVAAPGNDNFGLEFTTLSSSYNPGYMTWAAIVTPTALPPSTRDWTIIGPSDGDNVQTPGYYLALMNGTKNFGLTSWATATANLDSGIPAIAGHSYFVAVAATAESTSNTGSANFVVRDLSTGQLFTASVSKGSGCYATNVNWDAGWPRFALSDNWADNVFQGNFACGLIALSAPSLSQLVQAAQSPWSFWYPNAGTMRPAWYSQGASGGGGNVTITASPGTFTITGQSSVFLETLQASPGSLSITGSPAAVLQALALASGSLSLTGQSAAFVQALLASQGSLAITGSPAAFLENLQLSSGSFSIAGQAAVLNEVLQFAPGAWAISGQNATISVSGTSGLIQFFPGTITITLLPAVIIATHVNNRAPSSFYHDNPTDYVPDVFGPATITKFN